MLAHADALDPARAAQVHRLGTRRGQTPALVTVTYSMGGPGGSDGVTGHTLSGPWGGGLAAAAGCHHSASASTWQPWGQGVTVAGREEAAPALVSCVAIAGPAGGKSQDRRPRQRHPTPGAFQAKGTPKTGEPQDKKPLTQPQAKPQGSQDRAPPQPSAQEDATSCSASRPLGQRAWGEGVRRWASAEPHTALEATGHSVGCVAGVRLSQVACASAWAFGSGQKARTKAKGENTPYCTPSSCLPHAVEM